MGWFNKQTDQRVEITVSTLTLVRVLLSVVLVLVAIVVFMRIADALVTIAIAAFLALALNAPVHWIAEHLPGKRKGSRPLGTTIAVLIIFAVIGLFILLLLPPAVQQTTTFIQTLPETVEDIRTGDSRLGSLIQEYNLGSFVDDSVARLGDYAKESGPKLFTSIGGGLFSVLVTLVLVIMMLVEGPRWIRLAQSAVPSDKRKHATNLARSMYGVIKGYVNGQVLLAFIASLVLLPVMILADVPYAGALAVVVFVAGLIPMFGHYVGASIVTVIALTHSWLSAVIVLGFYILYQQFENYYVQPKVQANATNMSPLLVFAAVLVGASFGGLLGAVVAIPLAGCLRIVVLDYLKSRSKNKARRAAENL